MLIDDLMHFNLIQNHNTRFLSFRGNSSKISSALVTSNDRTHRRTCHTFLSFSFGTFVVTFAFRSIRWWWTLWCSC